MELPGDSDSFTGAEGDRISASFGLSEKQLGAKKLFSSLDLREQELAIGALLVLRSVRDRQLLECEEKASYFTVMLQKLLPRMGPSCVDSVLALLKNEQLAEAPIRSFVDFFNGLKAKLRGMSPVRIVEMTELVRRANALDAAAYTESLCSLIFRESRAEPANPLHGLLSQLFFEGRLAEFQPADLEARFPPARAELSELELKIGRLTMNEMLASEPGYDPEHAELARTAVHMLLGLREDSPRQLYAQLLRSYELGRVCAPLELVLHGLLSSYVRAAGNTLHSLLLGLSLLARFGAAGAEPALESVLVAVRALFQLGSLLAVKVNDPLINLSLTALLCSEQFRDAEARCSQVDCSKMWSFKSAKSPWLSEWTDWTNRTVPISRNFNLLSYGSQPRGLLGSDAWMTLRWAGVHSGQELVQPEQNQVLADRLVRLGRGVADPTLELALAVELGVREPVPPVEPSADAVEPEPPSAAPVEPDSDNFLTLDPADDDWANWTT